MAKNLSEFFHGPPLKPKPPSKIIENRTAWRIIIRHLGANGKPEDQATHDGRLILAPFAKRSLKCEVLNEFEFDRWEKRGFVRICPEPEVKTATEFAKLVHGVAWLTLTATLIAILIAVLIRTLIRTPIALPLLWAPWLYVPTLLVSAVAVWYFDGVTIRKWASEVISFLVVVLISLALSLGFFFLFTRDPASPDRFLSSVSVQAGIAVVFFVVLASSIPALLYYLFERQKSETMKEIFLRDAIRLNPNVYTLDEAEFRYGTLADEVYGHTPSQDFLGGLQVSLLVNLALTTLGWSLALMPNVGQLPPDIRPYAAVPLLLTPLRNPIVFGALGSYFFALNMLFRRYVRADLSAKAYTHVVMRQLITVTLVWVVSVPTQLWTNLTGFGQDALLVVAFFVGIVPETALAILQDYLRNTKVLTTWIPSLHEDQPLDDLEGVTLYDRARLLEEGVENVENLAHHNLIELMLRAHMPTPRLADLIDQAILYLHLYEPPPPAGAEPAEQVPAEKLPAEKKPSDAAVANIISTDKKMADAAAANSVPAVNKTADTATTSAAPAETATKNSAPVNSARAILHRYGIRTATDLEHARDLAYSRGDTGQLNNLLSLLDGEGRTPGRLQTVLDALEDDDWMPYLREWHRNQRSGLALTLEEIEGILIGLPTAKDKHDPSVRDSYAAPPKSPDPVIAVSMAAAPKGAVVSTATAATSVVTASSTTPPVSAPAAVPMPIADTTAPVAPRVKSTAQL